MIYRILADVVVVGHFLFIVFVLFGGFLALRWRWVPWLHIPCALWGAAVEFFGWYCPLTPLEKFFREAAGGGAYEGGFIARYLLPIIYPGELTRELQMVLGALVVVINVVAYGLFIRKRRREKRSQTG